MPYAAKDRQEFIKHIFLKGKVLDLGGMLSNEIPYAICGISTLKQIKNAVLMNFEHLPFKNSVFDTVVSYHYLDLISYEALGHVFKEIKRVMHTDAVFSFLTMLWIPQSEAQRSNLFFNEILKSVNAIYQHEPEELCRLLAISGFEEITTQSIKREITIPEEFVKEHLRILSHLLKKRKSLKSLAKQYLAHVEMHGEAMLPAIHFMAKKHEKETS